MFDNICMATVSVFFFIGLAFSLYFVLMKIISPKQDEVNFAVVVLGKNEKNAIARVGYLLTRMSVWGDGKRMKILAVDNGMSTEQYKSLLNAFAGEPGVMICSRVVFEAVIFGNGDNRHI